MIPATLNLIAWTVAFIYLNNTRAYLPVFLMSAGALLLAVVLFLRITKLEQTTDPQKNPVQNQTGETKVTTTEKTQSETYRDNIAHNVETLERICDTYPDGRSADELDELARMQEAELEDHAHMFRADELEEHQEWIRQARADAEWMRENLPEHEAGESITAAYIGTVLDIEIIGTYDMNAQIWEPTDIALLITAGGPNARIKHEYSGDVAEIEVRWWGESARSYVEAPNLCDYLNEVLQFI
jgi:hypothetical protein